MDLEGETKIYHAACSERLDAMRGRIKDVPEE